MGQAFALKVKLTGPLRAIADLVYLHREVSWERDGSRFLVESLRVERDDLDRISWRGFGEIRRSVRNRRVGAYLDGLREELGR